MLDTEELRCRRKKKAALISTAIKGMEDIVSSIEGESLVVLVDEEGWILEAFGFQSQSYIGRNLIRECSSKKLKAVFDSGEAGVLNCLDSCPLQPEKNSAAAPIIDEERVVGVLVVWVPKEQNVNLISSFLSNLGRSISRELASNKAYLRLASAGSYLTTLAELTKWVVAGPVSKRDLLQQVVDKLAGIVDYRSAVILVPRGDGEVLTRVAQTNADDLETISLEAEESPFVTSFTQMRTIIYEGYESSLWPGKAISAIAAPIIVQGSVWGVIGAYQEGDCEIQPETVAIFESAAGLVGRILENLQLYQEASKEKGRLNYIIEQIDEAVIILDQQGRVIKHNKVLNQWFPSLRVCKGGSLSELAEAGFNNEYCTFPIRNIDSIFHQAIKYQRSVSVEFSYDFEEHRRYYQLCIKPVLNQGVLDSFVATITDLTEHHNLEKVKAEVLATIAHELRTPLTAAKGYLDLLDMLTWAQLKEEKENLIESLREEVGTLTEMVEKIVSFTHFQLNKYSFKEECIDLVTVIEENLKLLAGQAITRNVEVNFIHDSEESWVWGDSWGIREAVRVLLDNAIKYTPLSSSVKVAVSQVPNYCIMRVENHSEIIPKEERDRIFQQFYRGPEAAAQGVPGSGMGLYIAKYIVEQHGGKIWVDDSGPGTCFVMKIPRERGGDCAEDFGC